jgi:predicted N-acetyltransferase YhbS
MTASTLASNDHTAPASSGDLVFVPERTADAPRVEALIDQAFGPGRFAKTAERLREGSKFRRELSVCAWEGSRLVGAVRQWDVSVEGRPILFLGPIAVDAGARRRGLGATLMQRAVEAAEGAGEGAILLVGDLPYFGQFGFEVASGLVMPGPVDPRRLLWRALRPGALDGVGGAVRPGRAG